MLSYCSSRAVLNALVDRSRDLTCYYRSEEEWETGRNVFESLEIAASIKKKQYGSLYITLTFSALELGRLLL